MALLTKTTSTAHGIALPAAQQVSSSDTFNNANGKTMIEINNAAGAPITATFVTTGTANVSSTVTYPIADDPVVVTNGTSMLVGPFKKSFLNDANDLVTVTFSSTTSVTARVIELGQA